MILTCSGPLRTLAHGILFFPCDRAIRIVGLDGWEV